jgi:hypothetical protein
MRRWRWVGRKYLLDFPVTIIEFVCDGDNEVILRPEVIGNETNPEPELRRELAEGNVYATPVKDVP